MFQKWLQRMKGHSTKDSEQFKPIYSLDQIALIGQLPIVKVYAFAGDSFETKDNRIGPGIGGILASLLRRDLIFTRQLSVLGGEDTGYLEPNCAETEPTELLDIDPDASVIITGKVYRDASQVAVRLRIVRRDAPSDVASKFGVRGTLEQLPSLMPSVASKIVENLGFTVVPAIRRRWCQHSLTSWQALQIAATSWEKPNALALAKLLERKEIQPDAMAPIKQDEDHREVGFQALATANALEPDNPQLAFNTFTAQCNFHEKPVDPRFETMLRTGLEAGPGHGKSNMVLPHILASTPQNIPYILAHSEAGYRLLPGNSFALNNFANYLMEFAPADERISPLIKEAIQHDPDNVAGYVSAINFFVQHRQSAKALQLAKKMVVICTPPISERTWYCFHQFPSLAKRIDEGKFVPLQFAEEILRLCEQANRASE